MFETEVSLYFFKIRIQPLTMLSMGPPPGLALGPPALFAMMIWSTRSTVQAAPTAYFMPQCFTSSRSKIWRRNKSIS